MYIPVKTKFVVSLVIATGWMVLSIWLSMPWFDQLSENTTPGVAIFLIGFIAIIPGFMNAFIMSALALGTGRAL